MSFSTTCRINRYYDPTTDSFISVDPAVQSTNQPYVFVNGDPLNATDPLGLDPCSNGAGQVLNRCPGNSANYYMSPQANSSTAINFCVSPTVNPNLNRTFIQFNITAKGGNFKKVSDSYLKQNNLNAEEIKSDIVGKNGSKYDIYSNKDTGDLYVGPKVLQPDTELQPTGFRISNGNLSQGFPVETPTFFEEGFE
jgi:uncharacterized protein RhaS with RHS repeats